MNEEEEKKDPEQELKEEIERYERQNQEAYDMSIENEIKRKRQQEENDKKKKDFLDSGSAFRTTAAIGTEVAANTLLDLFSFIPPAQVAGGSLINYLAQKIRGGEISEGEMVAAGLASLIPAAAQAKSLSGVIGKTALRGGVSGAIETGAADLIDTGKVDVENVVTGGAIGTAFGGIFGTAIGMNPTLVGNTIAKIKARVRGGDFIPLDTNDIVQGVGTVGAANVSSSNPNFGGDGGFFKKVVQKAFRNKATFPSLFVDPVTLKPKRGFTTFEMASAYDRYIDNLAKKSGYKSLADFKVQVLDTLKPNDKMNLFRQLQDGENLRTGYIEHLIAKASKKRRLERIRRENPVLSEDESFVAQELSRKSRDTYDMDWYWDETYIDKNGVTRRGLNKGDRDASRNVRINFNNRYKGLKDVTEQILYGTEELPGIGTLSPKLENRLVVSVEDIDKRSFLFNRTQLGDVVIRRAGSNKLIGKLGNYLDVLYPQNNSARARLEQNVLALINPNTGARYATLDEFRDYIIRKRIGIIVDEAPALKGKSNVERKRLIDEALQQDLIQLYEDYPFLPKPKYISEITDRGLDQLTKPPFPTKSDTIQQTIKGISGLPGGG